MDAPLINASLDEPVTFVTTKYNVVNIKYILPTVNGKCNENFDDENDEDGGGGGDDDDDDEDDDDVGMVSSFADGESGSIGISCMVWLVGLLLVTWLLGTCGCCCWLVVCCSRGCICVVSSC